MTTTYDYQAACKVLAHEITVLQQCQDELKAKYKKLAAKHAQVQDDLAALNKEIGELEQLAETWRKKLSEGRAAIAPAGPEATIAPEE